MNPRLLVAVVGLTAVLLGCGDEGTRAGETPDPPRMLDAGSPPPIEVMLDGETVPVWQGSFCWTHDSSSMCSDSIAPRVSDLVDVGSPDSVEIVLGVATDSLSVHLTPLEESACPVDAEVEPVDLGGGHFRLDPAGPAGRYRVEVFGRAVQGEVPGAFRWTTPVDGPSPEPEGRMSIVWEPHGHLEGQGFLFTVDDLATTPTEASASVTVTAGNGEQLTFDAGSPSLGCPEEGHIAFSERGTALSDEAADLGPTPFTYEVDLTLDGTTYTGTGTYPEPVDSDPENDNPAPVLLAFDPPLPARGE